jgi:hypothetical protein
MDIGTKLDLCIRQVSAEFDLLQIFHKCFCITQLFEPVSILLIPYKSVEAIRIYLRCRTESFLAILGLMS